nr:hypothetical protein CFP56_03142 [Quercus suber]
MKCCGWESIKTSKLWLILPSFLQTLVDLGASSLGNTVRELHYVQTRTTTPQASVDVRKFLYASDGVLSEWAKVDEANCDAVKFANKMLRTDETTAVLNSKTQPLGLALESATEFGGDVGTRIQVKTEVRPSLVRACLWSSEIELMLDTGSSNSLQSYFCRTVLRIRGHRRIRQG